jgi:hypothetical protein
MQVALFMQNKKVIYQPLNEANTQILTLILLEYGRSAPTGNT